MSIGAIVGIVIGAVAVLLVLWLILGFNKLTRLRNNVDEAFSTMDVYLKKRYDLIPNLVETAKGYMKHEGEVLEKVMKARYNAMNSTNANSKMDNENILSGTLKSLFKVTENYPDLKADKHFTQLMKELTDIENELVSARKYYNGTVKQYNTSCAVFPRLIIAKIFRFEKRKLFEVESIEERKNVKVQF